ncbi:MAG: ROK family protein [Gammaproteobacteria bacterium]|nr:ROK family protein [Gammaproteobacteria bacterium]
MFAAIEAGGTKFNVALAADVNNILVRHTIPTTSPHETLSQVIEFIHANEIDKSIKALGLASFGPIDLDRASSSYGHILATPKTAWKNTDLLGILQKEFMLPVAVDTDVNAAALAEFDALKDKKSSSLLYVTIGTGVGVGIVLNGETIKTPMHPEAGHMYIPQNVLLDSFSGCCPFHGNCLEGLASGTAMQKRWGVKGIELPDEHEAWQLEAEYLALMCVNLFRMYAPQKIVLGGGVMQRSHLLPMVHTNFEKLMGGYHTVPPEEVSKLIVAPVHNDPGLLGALMLAQNATN